MSTLHAARMSLTTLEFYLVSCNLYSSESSIYRLLCCSHGVGNLHVEFCWGKIKQAIRCCRTLHRSSGDSDRHQDLTRGSSTLTLSNDYLFTNGTCIAGIGISIPSEMASRGIAANCRKVVCIGRNYAYALPTHSSSPTA